MIDVPRIRGPFTFPAPWNTQACRVTNEEDGVVRPVGMTYHSNINNSDGRSWAWIFLSINDRYVLYRLDKATLDVKRIKELPFVGWGEGSYFSFSEPDVLYVPQGRQLLAHDVQTNQTQVVFEAPGAIRQCHSSADGRTHSMTLDGFPAVVRRGKFTLFRNDDYDECQIDKSGRWLLIKEGKPGINRIYDLDTSSEHGIVITDAEGAVGHSDMGYGYVVGEEDRTNPGGVFRLWSFPHLNVGPVYSTNSWAKATRYVSHCNAKPGDPTAQLALFSSIQDDIVLARLDGRMGRRAIAPSLCVESVGDDVPWDVKYWQQVRATIDPTGELAIWTANCGTSRLDAFVVRIANATPHPAPVVPGPKKEETHRMQIIIIAGTDWERPDPAWRRQPLTNDVLRFERARIEDWKNVFYEIGDIARASCLAIGCRGIFDTGAVAALPVARQAYDTSSKALKITFWGDTVGLGDIVNEPGSNAHKFDFANAQHIVWGWERFVGLMFEHFERESFFTLTDGRVVIPWWGIEPNTGHGIVNQRQAQRLLDEVTARVIDRGFTGAAHIVDKSWLELCPDLRVYAVHDWFNPWGAPPRAHSIRTHEGVAVGMTVPSFFEIINPDGNAETLAQSFARFAAFDDNEGVDWVLVEGATDWSEAAAVMRDASGSTEKLLVMRRYTPSLPQPEGDDHMGAVGTEPLFTLDHRAVIHNDDGTKSLLWNKTTGKVDHTSNRVFSLQTDGSYDDRPLNAIGPWEKGSPEGRYLIFRTDDARAVFPWQD